MTNKNKIKFIVAFAATWIIDIIGSAIKYAEVGHW